MMRIDYCERLRRGDAYLRVDSASIKIGRRILLSMFENRSPSPESKQTIEVGFPGEVIQKNLHLPTVDMRQLPSVVERAKLSKLIDVRKKTENSGATTTMARLMHMRLFGADVPYEDRSPTGLVEEMGHISQDYEADDQLFLFEENAQRLQLVVHKQGDAPVQNASLTLIIPAHDALHVATRLPETRGCNQQTDGGSVSIADYPIVSVTDNEINVSSTLNEIPVGTPIEVFELPLRICAGSDLCGKRLNIRYKLFGSNLKQPVEGGLLLSFGNATQS